VAARPQQRAGPPPPAQVPGAVIVRPLPLRPRMVQPQVQAPLNYMSANMNQMPRQVLQALFNMPNVPRPIRHRYPPMYITLTQDLPEGTVINLFHSMSHRPVAVPPVPDNRNTARIVRLPIYPPHTTQATHNPNPGSSRQPH
jgi:hypothetical protein